MSDFPSPGKVLKPASSILNPQSTEILKIFHRPDFFQFVTSEDIIRIFSVKYSENLNIMSRRSEGIVTVTSPPSSIFWKKEGGGVTVKNFFIKDFLSKKFFRRKAPQKEGGGICSVTS